MSNVDTLIKLLNEATKSKDCPLAVYAALTAAHAVKGELMRLNEERLAALAEIVDSRMAGQRERDQ